MPTPSEQTNLRLPADLKQWLAAQAQANHRSLNGEVVYRLQESRRKDEAARQPNGG